MPILKKRSTKRENSPTKTPTKVVNKSPKLTKAKPFALGYQKKKEYKIKGVIGIGTYGVVREAVHIPTGRTVALKIIKKHIIKEHHKEGMVERELSILKKIRHPHIVEFIDFFETKSKYYIAFELATGGELFDRICQKGKFTEKDAAIVITTVIGAVSFLHSRGIVHRDIKPENLLYRDKSPNSDLLLCDFGISKMIESPEDMLTTVCGSPGYTAPEILKHEPYSKPVDMWSIGVITYTLLCGYSPFHYADDLNQLYNAICHGRFTFDNIYWAYISRYAKDFIKSLLQVQPEKRLTAEEALQHTWLVKLCPSQIERIKNINGLTLPNYSSLKRPIKSYSTSATQGSSYDSVTQTNSRLKPYVKSKYLISDDSDNDQDAVSYPGTLQSHNTIDVTHYSGNLSVTLINKNSVVSQISSITNSTTTTIPSINHSNSNRTEDVSSIDDNKEAVKEHDNTLSVHVKPSKDQFLSPSSNISDTSSTIIVQSNSVASNISTNTSFYSDPSTVISYSGNSNTNDSSPQKGNMLNKTIEPISKQGKTEINNKNENNIKDDNKNTNSITKDTNTDLKINTKQNTKNEKYGETLSPNSILESDKLKGKFISSPESEHSRLSQSKEPSPGISITSNSDFRIHSAPVSSNHSGSSSPVLEKSKRSSMKNLKTVQKRNSSRSEKFLSHLFKKKSNSSINLSTSQLSIGNSQGNNCVIPPRIDSSSIIPPRTDSSSVIPPRTDSKNQTINKHAWKTLLKTTKGGKSLFRRSKDNLKSGLRSLKGKQSITKSLNDIEHSSQDGDSYDCSTLTDASSITINDSISLSTAYSNLSKFDNQSTKSEIKKIEKKSSKQKLYTRKSFSTGAVSSSLSSLIKSYQDNALNHNTFLTIPNMEVIEKKINTFENNDKLKKINDLENNDLENNDKLKQINDLESSDKSKQMNDLEKLKIGEKLIEEPVKGTMSTFEALSEISNKEKSQMKTKTKGKDRIGNKNGLGINTKYNKNTSDTKSVTVSSPLSPWSDDAELYDYIDEMDILYSIKAEKEKGKKKSKKNVKCRSKLIFSGSEGWYPEDQDVSLVKENGEIKGYYQENEKNGRNRNGKSNFEKKVMKEGYYNTKTSRRPIPSIILTERTETNSSTSSLIPPIYHLQKFSKKQQIIEENDDLDTDLSEDSEDYDDLDVPLEKTKGYKSKPLSSTPLDDIVIGPHDLEKIAINNELNSQHSKSSSVSKKPLKTKESYDIIDMDSVLAQTSSKPNEKPALSPKKPLKTKESYDLLDDIIIDDNIKSAPPFTYSKPIDIKLDRGKSYYSHPTSPNIVIQPSTPVNQSSFDNFGLSLSKKNSNSNSTLTPILSTVSPSDVSIGSSSPKQTHTVHKSSSKKLNKVGRRGAFYDHNNDPDLLSISIPSTISQSFSSNTSGSFSSTSMNSPMLSTFNYQSFSSNGEEQAINHEDSKSNDPVILNPITSHSSLLSTITTTSSIDALAFSSVHSLGPGSTYSGTTNLTSTPVAGLTIGTNMYVEQDQISTSVSSSGEEDFEEDIYQYSFNQPTYGMGIHGYKDDDLSHIPILPDEHYIANFSANGVKPEIPSFEREEDDLDSKNKGKRARAKSDSRCVVNDDRGMKIIEEENDGLLHPNPSGLNNHKRLNSTGAYFDQKSSKEGFYEDDLEMPNLLSEDLYSKVLRKKFQRAVRIIKIVRRLSSKSSVSSSSVTYNNTNDVSDTSSFYSNSNATQMSKIDHKNTLTVGTHSRTSSITSNISNIPSPSISSEVLVLTPKSSKHDLIHDTRSIPEAKLHNNKPLLTAILSEDKLDGKTISAVSSDTSSGFVTPRESASRIDLRDNSNNNSNNNINNNNNNNNNNSNNNNNNNNNNSSNNNNNTSTTTKTKTTTVN